MHRELEDYEKRELAIKSLTKVEDFWGVVTPNRKILEGLALSKELISCDEDQYYKGLADGKACAKSVLEPHIKILIEELGSYIDNQEDFPNYQIGETTIKAIEEDLSL